MSSDIKFVGWMGLDKDAVKKGIMVRQEYQPKSASDDDVDIKITHCGICGSDLHTLNSGWGKTIYPVCVGHEIVGTAVRVGSKVQHIKTGDRVGVGAQSSSCLKPDCYECTNGEEQYCKGNVGTYNSRYPDGSVSYGGYADYARVPGHFVFKIPDSLPSEAAAPMLCGGATMYSPLVHNGCGPGKTVGIVGIGGLGHMGLQFAKALGASKVVAISRTSSKKDDALKLGADQFIATDEEPKWHKTYANTVDLIINTVDSLKMPLTEYVSLLKTGGSLIQVGAPEGPLPQIWAFPLIGGRKTLGGSMIASPQEIRDMLNLAAEKGLRPWVEQIPMSKANEAVTRFDKGEPRYRFVLFNEEK